MKRKHWIPVCIAAIALAAILFGCSAAAPEVRQSSNEAATAAPMASAAPSQDDGSSAPAVNPGDAGALGRKVIYTESMSLEAKNAAQALHDLSDRAVALGGYVSDMQYDASSSTGSITLRIPPEKIMDFEAAAGSMGKVQDIQKNSQDVTDQYADIQSRLKNAQAQEAQLLLIMQKAVTIDDILKVRKELDSVQQEIEQMQGQLKLMDNEVGFSTVTVSVRQPPAPAVTVAPSDDNSGVKFWGFQAVWQKISRGAADSFNWTLNAISWILMALSYLILPLLIAGAVVVLIVWLARRGKKRGKPAAGEK